MLVESYDQTTSQILMIPGRGGEGDAGVGGEVEQKLKETSLVPLHI